MTDYHHILILSMLRMLPACALLFGVLPALLFPAYPSKSAMERIFGMALFMGALSIVMMHVFVMLKINDNVALVIICVWIIGFKWWTTYRRRDIGFVLIKSVLLRWIEIFSRPSSMKRFGITLSAFWHREVMIRLAYIITFTAICAAAVVIRIGPIWNHPAPLSPEYYEILEQVKRLQINQMQTGSSHNPMGMPVIISALCSASQVNPTMAVHFFGIVASLMLCASLYFSVYTAVRSRLAAAIATALFACAYALLPVTVDHQIEADNLTLALAFLLPSLSFLMNYIANGTAARLFASFAGLAATAFVDYFAGSVGLVAAATILCASFFMLPSLPRLRGKALALHAALASAVTGAAAAAWWTAYRSDEVRLLLKFVFYDSHFYRYAQTDRMPDAWFLILCAALCIGMIAAAFLPRTTPERRIHLIGWGFTVIVLLALLPPFSFGLPDTIPAAEVVFVLSLAAAVGTGIWTGLVLDAIERLMRAVRIAAGNAATARTVLGAAALCTSLVLLQGTPASLAVTAEPDGFVRNLYVIERTFIPYQWTIVAHRGILLAGMNRGRFMDYDYFTAVYDPATYHHGKPGAIPTALVFIFIEKSQNTTGISSELASLDKNAMRHAREWCEAYIRTHDDMTVFYSDESVIIYQLRDPKVSSLRV